ncbi:MAG: ABC transporter permease subunit, partial [Chloroflexota bacterium]|nr:ABC transporter permease subunit [Chloroflexota bacterium]
SVLGETRTDAEGFFLFPDVGEQKGESVAWSKPAPVILSRPQIQGFNVQGGLPIKPEYAGLLLGLVVYTAAFIAEIVRAGINSVSKGQWEASRALGLNPGDTLRLIVLPQALRVAIPPMTSQFLNLTKNSSLAVAVGYPDLFGVSQTILNQSGAELQIFVMLMGTYLSFSLVTSALANWYNRTMSLKER